MKHLTFLVVVFIGFAASAQTDTLIYSFVAKNGKVISLSHNTEKNLLIYRCVKQGTVELEVVDDLTDDLAIFSFQYYHRPGGKENDGLDLKSVRFDNGGFHYEVYSNYSATEEETSVGVFVKNNTNGKTFDLKGKASTEKGNLYDFLSNDLIPILTE